MKRSHETLQGLLNFLFTAPTEVRRMRMASYLSNVSEAELHGILALTKIDGSNVDFATTLKKIKYLCHCRAHTIQLIITQQRLALRLMEGTERAIKAGIDLDEFLGIRRSIRRITERFKTRRNS